jgi:hypothetical protein
MSILTFQQQTAVKPISDKNSLKFNQIVTEVINSDLVDMLGAAMVTAIQNDSTAERFTNILDSKTYENCNGNNVRFEGLRYVLAYLVYARYIKSSHVKDTFSGMVRQNRAESEFISDGTLRGLQQEAKDIAVAQFKLIEAYLQENSTVYPEWEKGVNRKQFKPRMINIRKTYY